MKSRKEQIKEVALSFNANEYHKPGDYNSFIAGAEWADANPDYKIKTFPDELINQIIHRAIICGEVTVKFNEDKTFEIVNPFTGCGCGETTK